MSDHRPLLGRDEEGDIRAFQAYLDSNPRGKHGSVRYELQRHFGASPDELRSQFAFYFERFDVRPEGH